MQRSSLLLPLFLAFNLTACDQAPHFSRAEPGEALSAGAATVTRKDKNAFLQPSANLDTEGRLEFSVGENFFRSPWVIAPTITTARDGLGPLFNTNACGNCHIRNGRGHPPEAQSKNAVSMLVRLSIPAAPGDKDTTEHQGVVPEPKYGSQLQDMAIPGVAPEGKVRVAYSTQQVHFADGYSLELRKPELKISQLGYGPMQPDTLFSIRIAPPMIGLGLLEAIPEQAILAHADPDDRNGDGIAGQANWVWDEVQQKTVLGRFGLKAGQPSLFQQSIAAFANDLGLTSSLQPRDQCTESELACRSAQDGGKPEISDNIMQKLLFYTRHLGVPARRQVDNPQVLAGKGLFYQAGCQSCHVAEFVTSANAAEPELANQRIHPYSDLLLHDMGEGLADGRGEFRANGRQWRTPPLWGIGLTRKVSGHTEFLHDGRARNLLEAIAWHSGEAEQAKLRVLTFDSAQRQQLLAFLNSL